jgi:hypothetical protein
LLLINPKKIWQVDRTIVTVPEVFAGAVTAPVRGVAKMAGMSGKDTDGKNAITEFKVLQNVTGVFRPGEITLVLAPPGHGGGCILYHHAAVECRCIISIMQLLNAVDPPIALERRLVW